MQHAKKWAESRYLRGLELQLKSRYDRLRADQQDKNEQKRRGKSHDLTAVEVQMNLSNAFQATDVVKKELNQNMQFLLELRQKAA